MDNLPVPPNPTAPNPKPAGNFIQKHPIWSILIGFFVLGFILQAVGEDETSNASGPSPTMATSTVTETVSPEPTETYSPEPTEAPEPAPETDNDAWMKAMAVKMSLENEGIYTLSDIPNKAIDEAGKVTCETAEQLSPLSDSDYLAMVMAVQNGLDVPKMEAARIAGAFIGAYCPKYIPS